MSRRAFQSVCQALCQSGDSISTRSNMSVRMPLSIRSSTGTPNFRLSAAAPAVFDAIELERGEPAGLLVEREGDPPVGQQCRPSADSVPVSPGRTSAAGSVTYDSAGTAIGAVQ